MSATVPIQGKGKRAGTPNYNNDVLLNLVEFYLQAGNEPLGKLVTKIDKRRLIFVMYYRTAVFLLTLTNIDKNLTLSHRFCRIRQKVTKQSLWSQATINNQ